MFTYNLFSPDVHARYYNLTLTLQTDSAINRGERFIIDHVADIREEAVFLEHATNLLHYEPLFSDYDRLQGYRLKDVAALVRLGSVTETDGAYFNMTNPASLVFPKQNNLQPFERIKISEEEQLQAFVQRRQPKWKIPKIQVILNWVSLGALLLTLYLIFFPADHKRINSPANRANGMNTMRKRS